MTFLNDLRGFLLSGNRSQMICLLFVFFVSFLTDVFVFFDAVVPVLALGWIGLGVASAIFCAVSAAFFLYCCWVLVRGYCGNVTN